MHTKGTFFWHRVQTMSEPQPNPSTEAERVPAWRAVPSSSFKTTKQRKVWIDQNDWNSSNEDYMIYSNDKLKMTG